jgi:hypothetical protein
VGHLDGCYRGRCSSDGGYCHWGLPPSYQWAHKEQVMEKENFPIVYVTEPGTYKCSVCIHHKIVVDLKFAVACKELYVMECY